MRLNINFKNQYNDDSFEERSFKKRKSANGSPVLSQTNSELTNSKASTPLLLVVLLLKF